MYHTHTEYSAVLRTTTMKKVCTTAGSPRRRRCRHAKQQECWLTL